MNKERAKELWPIIKAYGEGREVQYKSPDDGWKSVNLDGGFYIEYSDSNYYRIKPEPKMRPMTRGEVLYMVTTTPGMVVRFPRDTELKPYPAANCDWDVGQLAQSEYAIIDESGEPVDGWYKFEKEIES